MILINRTVLTDRLYVAVDLDDPQRAPLAVAERSKSAWQVTAYGAEVVGRYAQRRHAVAKMLRTAADVARQPHLTRLRTDRVLGAVTENSTILEECPW
ncbi:hypothetical protein [Polymorphospora rubra]|uniref:Uncharacterized protein n=1 Tax=Polymorphospora rubra TaxID=338584 RepID=A0A810MVA5_9ACTN|nr:hypothetical protein [Polymorphospora rubra]BCJ65081.1 hypothetical protein Prubr_21020 [Polymorphospora rubra]